MSNTFLISVITVCRNSSATISRTFDSILQQTHPHIDYVLIDGASTDGTLEIVKAYEDRFCRAGTRFRWISEPDNGIYDAMNKGIAMATGDIIGILNSDDYYEPDTVEAIADASVADPDAGIYYGFIREWVDGAERRTYRYRYDNYLLNRHMQTFTATQHPTCFVRQTVYRQIGQFDTQLSTAADYDFLLRAMKRRIGFHAIDRVLCNFSLSGASTRISDDERQRLQYAIRKKNDFLSEAEEREFCALFRYQRYKTIKSWVMRRLLR